jgi:hypothetical protein
MGLAGSTYRPANGEVILPRRSRRDSGPMTTAWAPQLKLAASDQGSGSSAPWGMGLQKRAAEKTTCKPVADSMSTISAALR